MDFRQETMGFRSKALLKQHLCAAEEINLLQTKTKTACCHSGQTSVGSVVWETGIKKIFCNKEILLMYGFHGDE